MLFAGAAKRRQKKVLGSTDTLINKNCNPKNTFSLNFSGFIIVAWLLYYVAISAAPNNIDRIVLYC
jgi:hypothetical protein